MVDIDKLGYIPRGYNVWGEKHNMYNPECGYCGEPMEWSKFLNKWWCDNCQCSECEVLDQDSLEDIDFEELDRIGKICESEGM